MIFEHGQIGTAPAELVRLVLEQKDKEIRMLISEELGHSRINITSVYLGSWSKK